MFRQDQSLADERRQNELRRKKDRLQQSRNLYETLQAKNYEQYAPNNCSIFLGIFSSDFHRQMTDLQRRRIELLQGIKQKDRRTKHFVKDKQETTNLV